jgi:hypothetical protein
MAPDRVDRGVAGASASAGRRAVRRGCEPKAIGDVTHKLPVNAEPCHLGVRMEQWDGTVERLLDARHRAAAVARRICDQEIAMKNRLADSFGEAVTSGRRSAKRQATLS